MKFNLMFLISVFFLLMISINSVNSADFTPQGNINLRYVYNITGVPFVNATLYYGNGSQLTGVTADVSAINHSLLQNLQGGSSDEYYHINSSQYTELVSNIFNWITSWLVPDINSNYLYNDSTIIYFNETYLNASGDSRWVNVNGDTWGGDMSAGNYNLTDIQRLIFDTTGCSEETIEGSVCWNANDRTLDITTGLSNVIQLGQETWALARNGDSIPLINGQVVSLVGSSGDRGLVARADASNMSLASRLSVVTLDSCSVGAECAVTTFGRVRGLNTSMWPDGTMLYLSADGSGNLTSTVPDFPDFRVLVAFVIRSHSQDGIIFVGPNIDYTDGVTLNELYVRTNMTVENDLNVSGNLFGSNSKLINDNNYWNDTYATFNKTYADSLYLTGQLSLFFYNESDAFNSSYTIMNTTINPDLQVDTFIGLSNGDNLLAKRILSSLDLSILETGAYNQHTTIDYISGSKDVQLRSTLHVLLANGTEIQIGASPVSPVLTTGTYQQIIWTGVIDTEYLFSAGDYLTMYLYAFVSGGGAAPTIDLVVGGSTSARLDIGINPSDVSTTEVDPIFTAWDNFTGIPHATPSNGDVTHFSWADEIYDWVIGLGYSTTVGTVTSVVAGNGMDFTSITSSGSVIMGLPGSLTAGTSNALTATSHTHAVSGFLESLLGDTTPQLGGYLDANGQDIGSTTDEIENIYVGDTTRIYFGDGQDASIYFNGTNLIITG